MTQRKTNGQAAQFSPPGPTVSSEQPAGEDYQVGYGHPPRQLDSPKADRGIRWADPKAVPTRRPSSRAPSTKRSRSGRVTKPAM